MITNTRDESANTKPIFAIDQMITNTQDELAAYQYKRPIPQQVPVTVRGKCVITAITPDQRQ